jgi:hypothetical protein
MCKQKEKFYFCLATTHVELDRPAYELTKPYICTPRIYPKHSPLSHMQSQQLSNMDELLWLKCLGENISSHILRWTVTDVQQLSSDNVTYKVIANVNVLRSSMIFLVLRNCDKRLIIAVQCNWSLERSSDL